jgi:DNA-binding NtrC family response regulator
MSGNRFGDARILLVDDEQEVLDLEALVLAMNGFHNVATCADSRRVPDMLADSPAELVVLDITMPHVSGIETLGLVRQQWPGTVVVMLTGLDDAQTAVACLKLGAYDYIVKPVDQARLVTTVANGLERRAIEAEAELLGQRLLDGTLRTPEAFDGIVTADARMHAIFRYVEAVAQTDLPVLITGETGVGKELIARAIHQASGRRGQFVSVNSAGIDDTLFSDTLFGHAAGAFTGAGKDRRGLVDRAAHGTLFLDEVGDMRPESQVKLLRLLQERTYYRLGAEVEERCSARVVAATNRTLQDLQRDPAFRKDLFYRMKSHHVHVPALRERPGDIPLLAEAFLSRAAAEQRKPQLTAPPEFFTILASHDYPGTVRELQGVIYDAVSRHPGGVLSCESIKQSIGFGAGSGDRAAVDAEQDAAPAALAFPTPLPTVDEIDLALIREALRRSGGNKTLAAEMIGISRQTLRARLASGGGAN